jgi:hypothetical protein
MFAAAGSVKGAAAVTVGIAAIAFRLHLLPEGQAQDEISKGTLHDGCLRPL